jgi:hypothetical protein
MKRRIFLFSLLVVLAFAPADNGKPSWQGPDRPVYVVTQNHYAEGFGPDGNTPRFGDLIAIEIYNPKPRPADQDAEYNVGERLALFMGGQRTGDVSIKKVMPMQCDSSAAVVSAGSSVDLKKDDMALATNAQKIRPHADNKRQANAGEIEFAQKLAMDEFRKHGVPDTWAKRIKVDHLTVTRVDDGGDDFLIGLLLLETKSAWHQVFLIGRIGSSGPRAELARYHKTEDKEYGTDREGDRFVDQLDLDGDGTDEIVVEVSGYESEEFRIYKRQNGIWHQVHVGGQGGC